MDKVLLAIGIIAIVLGVIMIFDARPIVKQYFGFGEENDAVIRNENIRIFIFYSWWAFNIFLFIN